MPCTHSALGSAKTFLLEFSYTVILCKTEMAQTHLFLCTNRLPQNDTHRQCPHDRIVHLEVLYLTIFRDTELQGSGSIK